MSHARSVSSDDTIIVPIVVQLAIESRLSKSIKGEVRIDRIGTVANQQAEVMHFASFTRFDDQADLSSLFILHEMMMDRTGCHQRTHGDSIGTNLSVRQHDQAITVFDRGASFFADAIKSRPQPRDAFRFRIRDVDRLALPFAIVDSLQIGHLMVGQNRMRNRKSVTAFLLCVEQICFRADVAFQRHDHFFTDRVDRRIRHLREQLMEVVVKHARLIAEAGESCIVAHRADRILVGLDQRQQHEIHRFGCVSERLHAVQQLLAGQSFWRRLLRKFFQANALFLNPILIRTARRNLGFQFFVIDDAALFEVDQEHTARLKSALVFHVRWIDIQHAHFAGHDDLVVFGDVVTAWTQTVAIQSRTDVFTVGEGDRGWPVPGFLNGRVEFVEGTFVFRHGLMILPGFRHHHHHNFLQRTAGVIQHLQSVIEAA